MTKQPWERQPGESSTAFRAFALYRDAGPKRSLASVSKALVHASTAAGTSSAKAVLIIHQPGDAGATARPHARTRHSGQVSEWSRKYSWVDRAGKWDEFLDRAALRRTLSTVEQMAERHAKQNEQLLGLLMVPMVELAKAMKDTRDQASRDGRACRNDLSQMYASDLLKATLLAAREIPKLQEAERNSRGARVLTVNDPDAGTTGPVEWHVEVHQPERKSSNDTDEADALEEVPDAWEVAGGPTRRRPAIDDDGDDED